MSIKLLLSGLMFAVIFDNVSSYLTIDTIKVCNVAFKQEDSHLFPRFPEYDIVGTFVRDPANPLLFTKTDATGDDQFGFFDIHDKFRYGFIDGSKRIDGAIDEHVGFGPASEVNGAQLFDYLFDNADNCDCNTVENGRDTITGWRRDPSNVGGVTDFRACATVVDLDAAAAVTIDTSYWDCDISACSELETILQAEYQGFEIFSADGHCSIIQWQEDVWTCGQCEYGYERFKDNLVGIDDEKVHKCVVGQDYFGENCRSYQQEGCGQCDESSGVMRVPASEECHYAFCTHPCPTSRPTLVPNTFEPTGYPTPCVTSAAGAPSSGTPYDCRTYDERLAADPLVTPAWVDRILPSFPGCCENEYTACPCADVGKCDLCNGDGNGCSQCSDGYFIYTQGHECVDCDFLLGCNFCNDYYGCADCEFGTTPAYDEDIDLWYCALDLTILIGTPQETAEEIAAILLQIEEDRLQGDSKVPSPWICPESCDVNTRVGETESCPCGCERFTGVAFDECVLLNDEATNDCVACHSNGCDACQDNNQDPTQDFFAMSYQHPCLNCTQYFGPGCLFCNDFVGCAQCQQAYHLTFDECCRVWYCAL